MGEILYNGPLGGVPAFGYAYWGFDFVAEQQGSSSPVRPDEFVNRSTVSVTIGLTFSIPTDHACKNDCLPGVEFRVGPSWFKVDPPYVVTGNTVTLTQEFKPGQGYGWLIGLWQATNPRLIVTIPKGTQATLEAVGLPTLPDTSREIAATTTTCLCRDGTYDACSEGGRFSNGLLGPWYKNLDTYVRAGSFNNCASGR